MFGRRLRDWWRTLVGVIAAVAIFGGGFSLPAFADPAPDGGAGRSAQDASKPRTRSGISPQSATDCFSGRQTGTDWYA
ncbi:hypothetical protein, partial [Bifidobacterium bombi]